MTFLIAPCGMNCALCRAYTREKNKCPGCRSGNEGKAKSCAECKIKNCDELTAGGYEFCFQCGRYPCFLIKRLDKRYRTKYGMSMIENLAAIENLGLKEFAAREKTRWACPGCGETLCVHKEGCQKCGRKWR